MKLFTDDLKNYSIYTILIHPEPNQNPIKITSFIQRKENSNVYLWVKTSIST